MLKLMMASLLIFSTLSANQNSIKKQKIEILNKLNSSLNSGDTDKIYDLYKKLALIYTQNGEYYKSIEYYKLAIKLYLSTKKPNDRVKVNLYKDLAYCYRKIGNTFKSFKYTYKAEQLANKTYGRNSQVAKILKKEITDIQSRLIAASI